MIVKSCPFCRNIKINVMKTEDSGYYWAYCNKCKTQGPLFETPNDHKAFIERAISLWNAVRMSDWEDREVRCLTFKEC